MPLKDPGHAVILARIRLGVRRATGQAEDIEALLSTPVAAAASLARWRSLGVAELDRLLDQYQALDASPRRGAARTESPDASNQRRDGGGSTPQPQPVAAPAPDEPPTTPAPERQYLRGAR